MRPRTVILYSVLRLLAFLVPFGVLMLFPIFQQAAWLAAVFAAFIGLALSLLFLRRPRDEISNALARRRAESKTAARDEEIEDAAADAGQPTNAQNKNAP